MANAWLGKKAPREGFVRARARFHAKQAPSVHFRQARDGRRHAYFARVDHERSRKLLLHRSHFAALGGASRAPNLAIDVLANKSDAAVAADHVDPTGVKAAG